MLNTINLSKEVITILKVEYDVTGSTFKYVESLWFRYNKMVFRLKELELNVSIPSSSIDENAGIRSIGRISKPVEAAVIGNDRDSNRRQLEELSRIVHAIETVYNMLPNQYKPLVQERYWVREKKDWDYIADKIGYSKSHAYKIRKMIIVATAELLGLW